MPHVPSIICGCGHEMRTEKNGVTLNVQTPNGEDYYLIQSDRLRCGECDLSVYRLAAQPTAHSFESDYPEKVARTADATVRLG